MRTLSSTVRLGKRRMFWKVRAMPELGDFVRLQADQVLAMELDLARRGDIQPGDHVEDGGLAGAVGADQPHQLARLDADVKIGHGPQAAEELGQCLYPEQVAVSGQDGCGAERVDISRHVSIGLAPLR